MITKTIDLYAEFHAERGTNKGGYLTVLSRAEDPEIAKKSRPAVLVIPGGAYCFVSSREGEPVAVRFLAEGYAAFILDYSVFTAYPVPLIEGAMALAYIRREHERYCVDPDKVCVIGFSAGGHLAGMLTTMFGDEHLSFLGGTVRPDASVLCYPVLTTDGDTHADTAKYISGGDEELKKKLSVVDRVTKDCPPVFLWHTADDDCVPVQNSLRMAEACRAAGVPFELHIYESGIHGLSLADDETSDGEGVMHYNAHVAQWIAAALGWLKYRGFTVRKK